MREQDFFRNIEVREGIVVYKKMIAALFAVLFILTSAPITPAQALPIRLRVAFNENQAPFHYVDSRGKAVGLHIDMLEYIAERDGYQLEYYPMDTSSDCLNALERGEVDVILDMTTRLGDGEWVTEVLSDETICIVSRNDEVQRAEKTAAIQWGTVTPRISAYLQVTESLVVSDQKRVIETLISGRADVAVVLKESALYNLGQAGIENGYVISNNYIGTGSFALRVTENDYQLLQELNKGIALLRLSDTYTDIRKEWSQPDSDDIMLLWMKRGVIILLAVVLVVCLYAAIVSNVRRALRKQVEVKTLELQEANRQIQQHMEQLEAESDMRNRIIRYSYLAMVLFDKDGKVLLLNDSATALLKSWDETADSETNIENMPVFRDIFRACDVETLFNEETGSAEGVRTIALRRGDVRFRYRYNLQRILKGGEVWAVLLAIEDITDEEARRSEKFEEEKNRTLNRVVAGIAHEIKNPLTSIKTFVKVLETAHADPQFMQDFSCYVPAEVERINRLVESLIGYAKPARAARERVDLTALVQEVAFFAQSSNQNKRIHIVSRIEDRQWIMGNRDQIKQILINIVINGKESMAEKLDTLPDDAELTLEIALWGKEDGSVVTVRDEGMGMSAEAVEQCMNPFFTTKKTGTGLGLTLSRQFAKENNGELTIDSELGVYTQIRIEFRRE